jgi:hypothetical protein
MMVIVFFLLAILGVSIAQNVADLGILQLQLYSTSPPDEDNILDETIRITTDFLDAYFAQNFEQTIGENYFSHVELAVVTFDVLSGSAVSIDLVGSVSFQRLPIPGEPFLTSLLSDAFTGDARLEYVNALQTATIPFLRDISYLVIGMNNNLIANEDVAALGNAQNDSTKKVARKHLTIAEIAIIVGTSAGFVAVVIISSLLIMISREGKKNQDTNTTDKIRGRDMVVVTRTHSKGSSNTEIIGASRSVSPLRSVLSQDSSVFTYNPGSTTNSKKAPSTFSNDHSDGSMALDVEAWAQVSIASPADIDISAIELDKKDLSLIQEGDNEEVCHINVESGTHRNSFLTHFLRSFMCRKLHERNKDPAEARRGGKIQRATTCRRKFWYDVIFLRFNTPKCHQRRSQSKDS